MALAADEPRTKDGFTLLPPEQQVYRTYLGTTPTTLDPSYFVYSSDFYIGRDLFETLVRQLPDGSTGPAAATSWSVSADGKVYTFKLNPQATWSDGKPVTAADFVYSWTRLADPQTAAGYGSYLAQLNVVNADKIFKGQAPADTLGVKALDELTFEVSLTKPTPWFLDATMLQVLAPLRADVINQYGKDWVKPEHFVTNGPYKLTEYAGRSHIKAQLRKDYYDANNIVIQTVYTDVTESTNPNRNYFAYLTGEINTTNIPQQFRKIARQKRPEEIYSFSQNTVSYIQINNQKITDKDVRKAITLLWDTKFLLEKVLPVGKDTGLLVPLGTADAQLVQEPQWHQEPIAERASQAQQILTAKGYSSSKPLVLKLLTVGKPSPIQIAYLERFNKHGAGLAKLEFDIVGDTKSSIEQVNAGNYDLAAGGWSQDFNHIANSLTTFTCNDPNNRLYYCNQEFDQLVEQAGSEQDSHKRQEMYAQAVSVLAADFPAIPFYQAESIQLISPRLQGLKINNSFRYARDLYLTTLKAKPE